VEIIDEDPAGNGIPLGHHLGECIGVIVVPSRDVMQLNSLEPILQFGDLLALCVHEGAFAVRLLHDLVYHQLGVTVGVEPGCSELNGDGEAIDKALVSAMLFEARKWRRMA
jgi:hypothetical protein